MSNIFLSTSFVFLAQEEAGCIDEEGEVIDDCDGEAYGFQPASFVSNIAVIASVLSALLMPVIGAMVDFTDHRKTVGVVASFLLILIHVIQIGTVSKTWLAMAILQAFAGFLYQALVLATYAYLPDMSYRVDEAIMTECEYNFIQ
jgi:MFS-type transporter involved in bile tolerance (Atg22 family)